MSYILALIGMSCLEAILVMGILMVRPLLDPVAVVAVVTGMMFPTMTSIMVFIKTQETHVLVNGVSHELKAATSKLAHEEGRREGTAEEQTRQSGMLEKSNQAILVEHQVTLVEHALQSQPPIVPTAPTAPCKD